jgi:hypothetical protein
MIRSKVSAASGEAPRGKGKGATLIIAFRGRFIAIVSSHDGFPGSGHTEGLLKSLFPTG